jgi:DNA adenine methylase
MLRYHGGKWKIADWIIGHFPAHKVYVEPFGGGASVLLRKPRSYAEVYNDLEGEIVNVFRVARDHGPTLQELLRLTPFARDEFIRAYEHSTCPIETARRTIIRSFMGHGANGVLSKKGRTGFRANSNRSGTTPAHDWRNYADVFHFLVDRLRGIVLENRDAIEIMTQQDSPDTLFYVDPPYVHSTRDDTGHGYRHEMTDEQHIELAAFLKGLEGGVILSGYACDLYNELFGEWRRVDKITHKDGGIASVETLWISPKTAVRKGPLI